jgi:hypothetical protein
MSRKRNKNQSTIAAATKSAPLFKPIDPASYTGSQEWIREELEAGGKFDWIS